MVAIVHHLSSQTISVTVCRHSGLIAVLTLYKHDLGEVLVR